MRGILGLAVYLTSSLLSTHFYSLRPLCLCGENLQGSDHVLTLTQRRNDILLQYYRSKTPRNYSDFSDSETDKPIAEQANTMDQAKRKELTLQLQRAILDKLPFVQMHWSNAIMGWWPEVRGFKKPQTHYWRMEDVWLAQ
ncbi:MAG: hypothetical protein HYX92_11840 [Chloroflexi bacterium]|nr:hypothetical protein [Chloroflexota bacterium]